MRLLVAGGSGALGRVLVPMASAAGHDVHAPRHAELDLFDPVAVAEAVRGTDAVLHLATRIRSLEQMSDPDAWRDNDRLRAEVSAWLVDAALESGTAAYVQPTVTFVYPPRGPASEDTPIGEVPPTVRSALVAEENTRRFGAGGDGRRGVVLRLGLLDGPGTGHDEPAPAFGATLHVHDAACALLSALTLPSGIYNVCRDGERVSNRRFVEAAGWHPGGAPDPHALVQSRE
jgi:nucleoside-diphosphate-sugar epimerase